MLEVVVSAGDDVEVRRLSLTNRSRPDARDRRHQLRRDRARPARGRRRPSRRSASCSCRPSTCRRAPRSICGRRPRSPHEPRAWVVPRPEPGGRHGSSQTEWETSRVRFIGRGRTMASPIALDGRSLTGTTGSVLDPVVEPAPACPPRARRIRADGVLDWRGRDSREAAVTLAQRYHDRGGASARARAMAFTHSQMLLRHLGISSELARQYDRLASRVLHLDESLRATPEELAAATQGPVRAVGARHLGRPADPAGDRGGGRRHAGWSGTSCRRRSTGASRACSPTSSSLNEHPADYLDQVQESLTDADSQRVVGRVARPARWRVPAPWRRPVAADRASLISVARAVLAGGRGELSEQLDRPSPPPTPPRRSFLRQSLPVRGGRHRTGRRAAALLMANGLGGFSEDGREYVVTLRARPGHAGAVVQHHCQPRVRHAGHVFGRRRSRGR